MLQLCKAIMGVHQELQRIKTIICLCQILSLSLNIVAVDAETHNVYLNSISHCGHDKTFPVSPERDYVVRPDVSHNARTNSFRDCEVTFHSIKENGHICIIQEGKRAKILDNNVQLKVFDGLGNEDDEVIGHLGPYHSWAVRDLCSTQPYITFFLHEIKKENTADIREVQFAFKVVDIMSPKRTLYLDGTYCDHQYNLLNSKISLLNRPNFPGMAVTTLTSECAMVFDKVEETSNSSICVVYIPNSNVTCGSQWRFVISTAHFDVDEKFIVYDLHCYDPKANEMHVWCGSNVNSYITVAFWRKQAVQSNSSVEPPGEFRYIVTDYEGDPQSLLEKIKASLTRSESASLGSMEIILICISVVLFIIFLVIMYLNRKKLPCYKYTAVERKEPTDV